MMQELYKNFISSTSDGNPMIIFITVFIAFIINYKNIIEFFDSRKKVKIFKLEEALKNNNIKGADRELLENELTKEHFKITVGIDVEKEFREVIIKTHKSIKGELTFINFQRALPYLKFENNWSGNLNSYYL